MPGQGILNVKIELPHPHPKQQGFVFCLAKRVIVCAGRRGGKTVGAAIKAAMAFTRGKRVLYAAPTGEQTGKFWYEVCNALEPLLVPQVIEANGKKVMVKPIFRKNEAEQFIERIGTEQRLKAKTAWNADTLRGDYADELILDEFQLMAEDTWGVVGAPMLLDNDGNATLIYTPPSLRASGLSKATDPRHAAKMFKAAQADTTGRWKAFHFTSHDNPHISREALSEVVKDMSREAYRKEIMAEDDDLETSWLVYSAFDELRRKVERFTIPPDWPIYTFHDFGGANPAALFVARAILHMHVKEPLPTLDIRQGDYIVWREYLPGAGRSAAQHVEEFKRITKGYTVMASVGGSHQEDEIRQGYRALGWPISEPKTRGVAQQVDKVIQLFESNRVFVFKDVYNYLEELMNCVWEAGPDGKKTDKIHDEARFHLSACARYGFSHPDFVAAAVVTRNLKPIETLHFAHHKPIWARR